MRTMGWFLATIGCLTVSAGLLAADPPSQISLRYKFRAGETLRSRVSHDMNVEMSVSGSSMTTDSNATSTKVWKVKETRPDGTATFEHMVEDVEMKNDASGHMPTHYSSRSDAKPPAGYETVAKSVGVPLINITMDPRGKVIKREYLTEGPHAEREDLTLPLPEKPIVVGESWTIPNMIELPIDGGGIKRIRTRQVFTLNELKDGIAVIHMERQILSPIDPTTEVKLIQGESTGTIRFDIDRGRVVSQEAEVDRRVLGFRGPTSSIHLRTLFTEKLVADETKTAGTAVSENKPKRLSEARLPARTNAAAEPVSAVADIKIGSVEGRSQEPKVQRSALAATDIPQHAVDASESARRQKPAEPDPNTK